MFVNRKISNDLFYRWFDSLIIKRYGSVNMYNGRTVWVNRVLGSYRKLPFIS